jgi:uncharacterized damage-inducible protein DinB
MLNTKPNKLLAMQKTEWFNRKFPLIEDNGLLPGIIERLRGTPARLQELARQIPENMLAAKTGDKWSAKEEIGHLGDLETLWIGRLADLQNGLPELRVTDLANRQTHDANHNAAPTEQLLLRFRQLRAQFVQQLLQVGGQQLHATSLHPRMKTPMRIIDLSYFVAEHDDHHLANIATLLPPLYT